MVQKKQLSCVFQRWAKDVQVRAGDARESELRPQHWPGRKKTARCTRSSMQQGARREGVDAEAAQGGRVVYNMDKRRW